MRKTLLTTASSALAAAALVLGAGTAAADEPEQGTIRGGLLAPALTEALGSIGYGSAGTGSLMDLLTGAINLGSTTLSVDVPNSTGSYAPGSFGSYGPEASVGQLLTGSLGTVAGSI